MSDSDKPPPLGTVHLWAVLDCDDDLWSVPTESREGAQMDLREAERDGRDPPYRVARFDRFQKEV